MNDDDLDRIFKALGDPTRRNIIDRLKTRPKQSLFEICALSVAEGGTALSRQAITQHLDLLEKAGLVRVEWSGRTKLHSFDPGPLRKAVSLWLRKHL
ncbi:ArsR/SmtB family transcription factor [Pseudorhodoplanes sinuspersici]|uniref:Transcriptional regulator n=1 Tax=Pseudorhodoplanes sinuspersici TaxID=1235591 RepID=A0A1W6ZZW3_9HYPH|nr:helix-turn-helix domain-containing protein [Pseudorhodoplanes sinuspersici]ARQ02808.1 transcriptional regulator [Pseudorhodoplanes sinuspersici]RKE69517.1 ArsR family transcriptional regulator [Pseudorhodoplanes sinuspersici]